MRTLALAWIVAAAMAGGQALAHGDKPKQDTDKSGKSQPKADHKDAKDKGHGHDKKH